MAVDEHLTELWACLEIRCSLPFLPEGILETDYVGHVKTAPFPSIMELGVGRLALRESEM